MALAGYSHIQDAIEAQRKVVREKEAKEAMAQQLEKKRMASVKKKGEHRWASAHRFVQNLEKCLGTESR